MSTVHELPAPGGIRGARARLNEVSNRHRSLSIIVGMAIVGAILPLVAGLPLLSGFQPQGAWIDGFTNAGVYVLLAIGLNIVVGVAGLLDLGYAAFFAIGSYTYAYIMSP